MNKSTSIIYIIAIILAFISGASPIIGLILGGLLIFIKKNLTNDFSKLNSELEKAKLTKDEFKLIDLKEELKKLEDEINEKQQLLITLNEDVNSKSALLKDLNDKLEENSDITSKIALLSKLSDEIDDKKASIEALDELENYHEFGLYTPRYDLMNSEEYKIRLCKIREKQKIMVKNKTAVNYNDGWTLDGDKKKGQAMNNDTIKLIVRSFNNECDSIIMKVKFNNIEASENRIVKAYDVLNKLGKRMQISIKYDYLSLKIEELHLAYEYELKKQAEKEEQLRIKEQMREEAKALKEIENAKKKLEKEETHFKNAIKDLEAQLTTCSEEDKAKLNNKLSELNEELEKLNKDKEDIENREKNTRAGYVYVISNIGSFGENVYKIGMTRRLEPTERIRELGSASVPFNFDVHAMIFSNDAPSLENALHKKFADKSVNKINLRKEFFKVSLDEIEKEVKKNYNDTVTFTRTAPAQEYRESLILEKQAL